jgi:drug/metabolite transporter (DMT)-like permease
MHFFSFRTLPVNFLLVIPPLLWGGNFVVARFVGDTLPASWLNIFRWTIALIVLLPFGARGFVRDLQFLRGDLPKLVVLAMLGIIGSNTVTYYALHDLPANRASTIYALSPLFIILLKFLLAAHLPPSRVLLAATISLTGVAVGQDWRVAGQADSLSLAQSGWIMLLAALVWAGYCVALKEFKIAMVPFSSLIAQILIGVALQTGFVLLVWGPLDPGLLTGRVLGSALYLGVFPAAVGLLIWQAAISRACVSAAGVFMNLVPMSGVAFAWLFLSETIGSRDAVGMTLVATGVLMTCLDTKPRRRRPIAAPVASVE